MNSTNGEARITVDARDYSSNEISSKNQRSRKNALSLLGTVIALIFVFAACNKSDINNKQLMQESIAEDFSKQPYTYLQNKYIDLVLAYELQKQEKEYDPEKISYEEKLGIILLLDSTIEEETKEDIYFHENLERELITEINSHPYIQKFVAGFALKENYDENDIMIYTDYSDCDDAISKFEILRYYENGVDIIDHYLKRNDLTGDEEWNLPPVENSIQKTVRYTLHLKWGNKIEYMWNTSSSTVRTNVRLAMADWRVAANNKISFSEITKNVKWNKTCWIMGWKYFLRICSVTSGNFDGRSTIGKVPWANMDFKNNTTSARTYRHELGHALGLYHEHQRSDRDNYIKYNSNNVQTGQGSQFSKMTAGSYNYYGSTFDFNSIMLYSSFAYSKNGNATLTKKDGATWSAPTSISATDKNVIRQIYN
ncbi:MAG: hypothetical protein LBK03_07005 [Bacteroidales bacterium]|nr:hypothetical protein [Bacteroidales bacterium]